MTEGSLESNSRNARIASALFIFVCVPLSLWSESYVPSKIFVPQDPAATAANILANEFMFRGAILVHILSTPVFLMVTLFLYRIFRPVDKHIARMMLIPIVAQLGIAYFMEIFDLTALMILKSNAQQHDIAYTLMRIKRVAVGADKIIIGLSIFPWGLLVLRSGFLPKIFGYLLILSSIGYLIDTSSYILLDRPVYLVVRPVRYLFVGYLFTMIWMLVKGVRDDKSYA